MDIKERLARGTSYAAIVERYPTLKHKSNVGNLKKYLNDELPTREKYNLIKMHMDQKFKAARAHGIHVHDVHLQQWAMEGAEMQALTDFKASLKFINNFKKKLKYCSRKVTILLPRNGILNEAEKQRKAEEFVRDVLVKMRQMNIDSTSVWNHDQSGFEYEMVGNRTISFKGKGV